MAGEFRGSVVTTTTVHPTGAETISVQMPADIQAGDFLFVFFGGSFGYRTIDFDVDGTWTNIGSSGDHAKIASGSEAGALVDFRTLSGPFGGNRAVTAVALCYRFPYTPLNLGGLYLGGVLNSAGTRFYSNPTGNSFLSGGQFGGFVGAARSEFRITHAMTATSDLVQSYNPSAATWSGDLITDRTGLLPAIGGTFPDGIDAGGDTVADAFYLSVATTGSTHNTALDVDGPGTSGSGDLWGFMIAFPEIVQAPYWGILAAPG